ncbi:MAG: hypothetical protein OP8BY_0067 [Candidatus Saccharicenans subterraneus]|uniref:Uncharacterized protein n=1 Tax=Candidatus Saccharicenans subterraneus TaxID=2508984 RepID=A0A3E2BM15_9BACT|nr:MAG: hypothetical protein OP8BY_0067 [Candidatus Saccharicenans subterraneum]
MATARAPIMRYYQPGIIINPKRFSSYIFMVYPLAAVLTHKTF